MEYVTVYDQQGQMLGVLENAGGVSYSLKHNDLWTAGFSLPAADPKNALCAAHNLVRIPDGTRELGLYRIVAIPDSDETGIGGMRTYQLEHVMATLLDDVLFGYHEIGGNGIYTDDVIRYILARQTSARWQLGACDFHDQFAYHFENVSLLSALLSLGEVLTDEYTWEFDTTTTPWTVSLRRADAEAGCGIHYQRNLQEIHKTMDASALITRLYPLGYGEGVNQLTVRDVNGGLPYIDADTAAVWGVKASVWTDTRIEDAGLLLARARQVLEGYKNPYIAYTAKAVDWFRVTGLSWDNMMPGKLVRVMDEEHGIRFEARIVSVDKADVKGDPGDIEITIANAPRDAADSINTLADRVGIGELYSNADNTHPAVMQVYVPDTLVRINKMLLKFKAAAFRTYERGTASGGGSTQTSASGGGGAVTSAVNETVTYTSEDGGSTQVSTPQTVVSDGSGSTIGTVGVARDSEGNEMKHTGNPCDATCTDIPLTDFKTGSGGGHSHTVNSHSHTGPSHRHEVGSHTHGLGSHKHTVKWDHKHGTSSSFAAGNNTNGVVNYSTMNPESGAASGSTGDASTGYTGYSGSGSTGDASPGTDTQGAHTHTAPAHYHDLRHHHYITALTIPAMTVDIPAHGHNVKIPGHSHSVDIPAHTHSVSIPAHTHGMEYGIFSGSSARTIAVKVDGTTVPAENIVNGEVDIVPWLSKDQQTGRITRGAWHEVELVPDGITRIEANLFAQVFVQSVGGGDF